MKVYECEMLFSASFGFKKISEFLKECGFHEMPQVPKAATFKVKQTVQDIPDDAYLQQVADIIKNNFEHKDLYITECCFSGYANIRPIEIPMEV